MRFLTVALALATCPAVLAAQDPGPRGRGVDIGPPVQNPVYISGKVVMADGGRTPKETFAEVVCDGFPRATDQVNPKGEFDIDITGSSAGLADATRASNRAEGVPQGNHLGVMNLSNCYVRAELPEHVSTVIQLAQRSQFDNPDVGEITLTRLEGITGAMTSATIIARAEEGGEVLRARPEGSLEAGPGLREDAELAGVGGRGG